MMDKLRSDIRRYQSPWYELALTPGLWAIFWHRVGHWLYKETRFKMFHIFKPFYRLVYAFIEAFMQMRLDASAEIGGGLFIAHSGGIHIHPDAVIGEHCDIAHHVTIGAAGGGRQGVPRIGNRVQIGAGSTVVGGIEIGDGARIAANSLVMIAVPAGATVMGVPARPVPQGAAQIRNAANG